MIFKRIEIFEEPSRVPFMSWIWSIWGRLILTFLSFTGVYLGTIQSYQPEFDGDKSLRRRFLLLLGSSWLHGLVVQALLLLTLFSSSWLGWWTWIWTSSFQVIPPFLILTLGDTSPSALAMISFFAFLFSLSLGLSGVGIAFVTLSLFAGILSVQGALLIVFAERLGLLVFSLFKSFKITELRKDIIWRIGFATLFFVIQFIFGGFLIFLNRATFGLYYNDLWFRFLDFGLLYAWWAALETLFSLLFFHYYWKGLSQGLKS